MLQGSTAVRVPGALSHVFKKSPHLILYGEGCRVRKHPRHSFCKHLPEILAPRPEVVLQDDFDGPVASDALNEFEWYPCRQCEGDPGDAEAVETVQRGAWLAILAFLLEAIGLRCPPVPAHDRGPGLAFEFVEVVRHCSPATALRHVKLALRARQESPS